jgi:hypothetical protein
MLSLPLSLSLSLSLSFFHSVFAIARQSCLFVHLPLPFMIMMMMMMIRLMVSRVEMHVLAQLVPLMAGAKTPMLREQLIKAVDLVGKSMHPSRLAKPLLLRQRDELMRHLLVFLKEGAQQPTLRVLGVNAVATLVYVL